MSDYEIEEKESLFRRIEAWSLDLDLHIWYGVISIIALCVLLFVIEREVNKTDYLADKVSILQKDLQNEVSKNRDLVLEMEKQRQIFLSPNIIIPNQSVEKAASKVNDKITKVQDVLIDKASQPKIIKQTETQTVNVPVQTVVNKELNTMMFESYCSTVPDSPQCKGKKK